MSHLDAIAIVVLSLAAGWATFRFIKAYIEIALELRDES